MSELPQTTPTLKSHTGELTYCIVTPDNLDLLLAAQHQIWPQHGVDEDYLAKPEEPEDQSNVSWLVYQGEQLVGLTGVFSFDPDEPGYDNGESIWLDWFAILPDYRGQHLGQQVLEDVIAYCRALGRFKYFRIDTTYTPGRPAVGLYDKIMPLRESYTAEDTPEHSEHYLIYTISLDDTVAKPWNNQYLKLGSHSEGDVIC